jgi:hypothetical protein
VTKEAWRAAVARWGDPIFGLALLLTDQRARAETTTIAVFRRVFAAPPTNDPELALYATLARQAQPQRRMSWQRRGALPRALSRIAPQDRLLLGLWLVRHLSGAQLATTTARPAPEIVGRLAARLRQFDPALDERSSAAADDATHIGLERWLEHQLGLSAAQAEHVRICPACRAAQGRWQSALDQLRALLLDALRGLHLSQAGVEALEEALTNDPGAEQEAWWQQRRFWLPALVGGVGLLLAVLITPWRGSNGAGVAAPRSAQALVQATIDSWVAPPAEGVRHWRVQSLNLTLRDPDPVVTDVWLDGGSPAHRVEVHRGDQLVEWQLAEGSARFTYGGAPSLNSCRWNTGYSGHFERFDDAALAFRITPEEQQAVRDARLRLGAYGAGYMLLQQALRAPDLHSFGTRVESGTTLTVLSFTNDRVSPRQQVLLRIDPEARQLYAVQQVAQVGGQTQVRDLWRLQALDQPESGVPNNLPTWKPTKQMERLLDPACPAIRPEYVTSLRQLTAVPYNVYLPGNLPPGVSGATLFSRQPRTGDQREHLFQILDEIDALYVGVDRWLSIAQADPRDETDGATQRGAWNVTLEDQQPNGMWHGFVELADPEAQPFLSTLELWGVGWTRDELLAVVDSLKPLDAQMWREQDHLFTDAQLLPPPARDALMGAAAALSVAPEQMIYTAMQLKMHSDPALPGPRDPFIVPPELLQPEQLDRTQWLVTDASGRTHLRDLWSVPDGPLYQAQTTDGVAFQLYDALGGKLWTASIAVVPLRFAQPDMQMLQTALSLSVEPSLSEQDTMLLLEYSIVDLTQDDLSLMNGMFFRSGAYSNPLADGTAIVRLWLDRSSKLPQRLDIVQRNAQGQETPISSAVVTERRILDQPDEKLLTMPALPVETLTLGITRDGPSRVLDNFSNLSWTKSSFTWPHSIGLSIADERPPGEESLQLNESDLSRNSWTSFAPSGVWRQTRYKLDNSNSSITLTQGPRQIMRHIVRFNPSVDGVRWISSERFPVTIAGQPREAWLLSGATGAAVVAEVDGLLLHISGTAQTLRNFVIPHLADLRPRTPDTPPQQ